MSAPTEFFIGETFEVVDGYVLHKDDTRRARIGTTGICVLRNGEACVIRFGDGRHENIPVSHLRLVPEGGS